MKKIILILTLLFLLSSCQNQNKLEIQVELKNTIHDQDKLITYLEEKLLFQTTLTENNKEESLKKIIELEEENIQIKKEYDLGKKEFSFSKNKECSREIEAIKKEINYNIILMWKINITYSSKYNSCIYSLINYNKSQFIDNITINDFFTKKEIKRFYCTDWNCTGNQLINSSTEYLKNIK